MPKKYPQYIIDKVIELRVQKKHTVPDIAEMMSMPKSTIHNWLLDYPLEERTAKQTAHQKRAAEANRKRAAKKRQDAYDEGWKQAPELFKNPYFRDFINLYLAEGTKRDRNKVEMTNSDVAIMIMSHYWLKKLKNPNNSFYYRVQIHADHDEDEMKEYWANALNIDVGSVHIMRKSNSGKLSGRQFRSKYGVFAIQLSDTYLHSKIQAWMAYLRKQWVDKFGNQENHV